MPIANRSYIALKLDGVSAGFLKSVDGGGVTSEVITEPSGASFFAKKHIGQPKYEDFVLHLEFSLPLQINDWIAAMWEGNYTRKDGSVIVTDYNLNIQSERDFFNALITETTIPAMDGASKEPTYLTLKFAPELTRYKKASGKVARKPGKSEQKLFLPFNFRLEIEGLDCTRVNRIESFTVKQTIVTDDIGDARDMLREPGKLEFPNLKISLEENSAQSWLDWFEDFVIRGNNDDSKEKNGALTLLTPEREAELARITFFNLGIFKLAPEKAEPNSEAIKRFNAELYCERMEFKASKSASPK